MEQKNSFLAFSRAAFPVVLVNEKGTVLDKNDAAKKAFPALRRGADIVRRLPDGYTLEGGTVMFASGGPARRGVVFRTEGGILLLFLSRFQYPDGEETAQAVLAKTGGVLPIFPFEEGESGPAAMSRLCREMLRIGTDFESPKDEFALEALWNPIAARIGGAFRSLGYRIVMEKVEPYPARSLALLSPFDFAFLFGQLLLMTMKHSNNGIVTVKALPGAERGICLLRFSTRTALSAKRMAGMETADILAHLLPEYGMELSLLPHAEEIRSALSFSVDAYGKLLAEYRLPVMEQSPILGVRSYGREDSRVAQAVGLLLISLRQSAVGL